jgi:hypothetical protein
LRIPTLIKPGGYIGLFQFVKRAAVYQDFFTPYRVFGLQTCIEPIDQSAAGDFESSDYLQAVYPVFFRSFSPPR